MLLSIRDKSPQFGNNCFIAPSAEIIGDVSLGNSVSVWFHTVIRGDVAAIEIGDECNIQDGTVIHGTYQRCGVKLHPRVTVGHQVMLHGCEIGEASLIGMGSIIMDLAKVGKHCLIGAGSLVTEKTQFEDESLIVGRPAKAVRKLKPEEIQLLEKSADNYLEYMTWYQS